MEAAKETWRVSMVINHNLSAMFAQRQLFNNSQQIDKEITKLSSGLRINSGGDDASGLAVSEKMRAQIRGLTRAAQNSQDGISFIQVSEGFLQNGSDIIQRVRELAIQASNGIYTNEDRMQIQVEVSALIDEVDRIASHAQFNGLNMLTGRYANPAAGGTQGGSMWFHLGANMDQRERIYIGTMTTKALKLKDGEGKIISLSTPGGANMAIGTLDSALTKVNKQRADLGAYQNRLEFATKGLMVGAENTQASESRIRDADMALEVVSYVKNQILVQASTAMLAQANMKPQAVLSLLR
jgi:flagellin